MIGLRHRERDPELPALAGDLQLVAPAVDRVQVMIAEHMRRPGAPALEDVRWEYARWKPGVSVTCTYALGFADGSEALVVLKRYADGKDRILRSRPLRARRWENLSPHLLPRVALAEEATLLFVLAADRELPGTPQLLDRRKFAHILRDEGLAPAGSVRRRRLDYQLMRYKPERRAVYRAQVKLRDAAKSHFRLGCRVLPPEEAARVIARRRHFQGAGGTTKTPRLVGGHARYGILLETWLDVEAFAPDAFDHAHLAGRVLSQLHASGGARECPPAARRPGMRSLELADVEPLLRLDQRLLKGFAPLGLPASERETWCHGDFHPDQLASDGGEELVLLDLDLLAPGDPLRDLACWITDAVIEVSPHAAEATASDLLAGYAAGGGAAVDHKQLWGLVADELQRRAAGMLRRLERGSIEGALSALDKARELAP